MLRAGFIVYRVNLFHNVIWSLNNSYNYFMHIAFVILYPERKLWVVHVVLCFYVYYLATPKFMFYLWAQVMKSFGKV